MANTMTFKATKSAWTQPEPVCPDRYAMGILTILQPWKTASYSGAGTTRSGHNGRIAECDLGQLFWGLEFQWWGKHCPRQLFRHRQGRRCPVGAPEYERKCPGLRGILQPHRRARGWKPIRRPEYS